MADHGRIATYEKVSAVIGKEMDQAFKKIMRDLAAGSSHLSTGGVTSDDLKVFFSLLKGGGLGLDFQCLADKVSKGHVYMAENIAPTSLTGVAAMISGEISFGGTIRF